ncbi:hypothetical protein C8F04DRAFT_1258579 [Mycena alexandri]|uniref:Uncharacterized protein n=1 Tax=Mycena alexandri TaxID=1745969 RepID=A0AAD6X202_9AGAR|nr:hypothetical protein C8F04DRAFT_1258579 [Mycena alexandri]
MLHGRFRTPWHVISQSKDYSAALASLQSNYGLAGSAPSICPKKSRSNATKPIHAATPAKVPGLQKEYQTAFGMLSSQFGFGAAAPKYQAA